MKYSLKHHPKLAGFVKALEDWSHSESWERTRSQTAQRWAAFNQERKRFQEWSRIRIRRVAHIAHGTLSVQRALGPASFLTISAALGVALTLTTLYSTSYAVTVDGEPVGVVDDQEVVSAAIQTVEEKGTALLGYDYQVTGDVDYQFALTLKSDLTAQADIEQYFFQQLNSVSTHLRKCQVLVDGRPIGAVKDERTLTAMLEEMKEQYVTEDTVSAEFVEDVDIDYVYTTEDAMTTEEMEAALEANSTGETTYTVVQGDTFNAIAYANDMSVSELEALNPDFNINQLMVGDVLNVKELVPTLSVQTQEHQVYREAIPCPVETRDDPTMYKGSSKIITKGTEGEAEIEANVTFINGYEREREVLSRTTLREPTTTVKAVGTKEKPKTASKGSYIWPVRGKITSYFGGRYIFGGYSYHSGLDIACPTGTTIKAADGGTVTLAGWKGSYGKLVIITHDNGTKTYYGHNSDLLVSAGQKVYQGQPIAKSGNTGRSTGPHCHFEVRVRGSCVNPLNYLR